MDVPATIREILDIMIKFVIGKTTGIITDRRKPHYRDRIPAAGYCDRLPKMAYTQRAVTDGQSAVIVPGEVTEGGRE
jgi:hypothetical protein